MWHRMRQWFVRRDIQSETQRAGVALILAWVGTALGAFLAIWGIVAGSIGSILQGLAMVILGLAVAFRNP